MCLDAAGAQGLQVTAGADFDFVGTGLVGVATKSAKSEADAGSGEGMFDLDVVVAPVSRSTTNEGWQSRVDKCKVALYPIAQPWCRQTKEERA